MALKCATIERESPGSASGGWGGGTELACQSLLTVLLNFGFLVFGVTDYATKLRTAPGRALYALRKVIVEPVFGQIKGARGFRRFLLRGLEKIGGEWSLVCLTHNLLKLWRYGYAPSRN